MTSALRPEQLQQDKPDRGSHARAAPSRRRGIRARSSHGGRVAAGAARRAAQSLQSDHSAGLREPPEQGTAVPQNHSQGEGGGPHVHDGRAVLSS